MAWRFDRQCLAPAACGNVNAGLLQLIWEAPIRIPQTESLGKEGSNVICNNGWGKQGGSEEPATGKGHGRSSQHEKNQFCDEYRGPGRAPINFKVLSHAASDMAHLIKFFFFSWSCRGLDILGPDCMVGGVSLESRQSSATRCRFVASVSNVNVMPL